MRANDADIRKQLIEELAQAELDLAKLRASGSPLGREGQLFEQAGRLRAAIEKLDREGAEIAMSLEQQRIDDAARRYLNVADQLEELRTKPNAAADVDLLTEELDRLWATLGKEGQAYVREFAPRRR